MRHLLNYLGLFLLNRTAAFGCSVQHAQFDLLLFFATALVGVFHVDMVVGELFERLFVVALSQTLHLLHI